MPAFARQTGDTQTLATRSVRPRVAHAAEPLEKAKLGPYDWNLPPGFPFPNVPHRQPNDKREGGIRPYLFYDKRLSLNQAQSCAICHRQDLAFTDGRARGSAPRVRCIRAGP